MCYVHSFLKDTNDNHEKIKYYYIQIWTYFHIHVVFRNSKIEQKTLDILKRIIFNYLRQL